MKKKPSCSKIMYIVNQSTPLVCINEMPMENIVRMCKVVSQTYTAEAAAQPFSLHEMQEVFWFRTNTNDLKSEKRDSTSTEY